MPRSVVTQAVFAVDGTLAGVRVIVEDDSHPPVVLRVEAGEVNLGLDGDGRLVQASAVKALILSRYATFLGRSGRDKADEAAERAIHEARVSRLGFSILPADFVGVIPVDPGPRAQPGSGGPVAPRANRI